MSFIWRNLLVTYLVILGLKVFVSAVSCKNKACCFTMKNNSVIDLSSIGRKDGIPRFYYVPYVYTLPDNTTVVEGVYSYNPCYGFSLRDLGTTTPEHERKCENAAACKLKFGNSTGSPPELYAIGSQGQASFFELDDTNFVHYNVEGKPKSLSNLTVELICDYGVKYKLEVKGVDKFIHNMTLTTECACPDKCKSDDPPDDSDQHGLSTGSVLLITFFVIVIVYFAVGVAYNFCNGAHGQELIPHNSFWTDFPQLVTDGFIFTCSCFTRRSQDNYSDM